MSRAHITVVCKECRLVRKRALGAFRDEQVNCLCKSDSLRQSLGMQLLESCEERGGQLVSSEVRTTKEKYEFRCADGHTWKAQGGSIIYGGTWCPECAGIAPRGIEELRRIVQARGGKLVSEVYAGVDAKYAIVCNLGHPFENQFKKIEAGQWCPTCNKPTISEEVARVCLEDMFNSGFPKKRPTWLRNSQGNQMELDGYSEELGIAFEYQGIQHFSSISRFPDSDLDKRIRDDDQKQALCKENSVALFILTHEDTFEDFPKKVLEQANRFGPAVEQKIVSHTFNPDRAYVREDRIEELRVLLRPKEIEVLSSKWLGSNQKYSFHCKRCGNKWQARGNSFFNSRRVAGCDRCARANAGLRMKIGIDGLQEMAAEYGGRVLSETYGGQKDRYRFECILGHTFEGIPSNMRFRKQFCPTCEGRQVRKKKLS